MLPMPGLAETVLKHPSLKITVFLLLNKLIIAKSISVNEEGESGKLTNQKSRKYVNDVLNCLFCFPKHLIKN